MNAQMFVVGPMCCQLLHIIISGAVLGHRRRMLRDWGAVASVAGRTGWRHILVPQNSPTNNATPESQHIIRFDGFSNVSSLTVTLERHSLDTWRVSREPAVVTRQMASGSRSMYT
jgi:hypothetical protein